MDKVSKILSRKNRNAISVAPNCSVLEALKIMANENIGSLVVKENDKYTLSQVASTVAAMLGMEYSNERDVAKPIGCLLPKKDGAIAFKQLPRINLD